MPSIIEVNNVFKQYANHLALNDVSLAIERGKVFGLLGPNGAGKTTLIRIINCITAPDKGRVLFNGAPISPKCTSKIGYLPEERGLYKKMKVGEEAIYLCRLKGLSAADAKKRLVYWFEKFDIMPWWNKKVEELSKGMAQKVQFITTILHEPELLIFDEPFSGFDPINAELLKNEILELRDRGATIIFSTHNMESVEQICDDIALINKSQVVLNGSVTAIKEQHRSGSFTVEFDARIDELPIKTAEVVRTQNTAARSRFDLRLRSECGTNELLSELIAYAPIRQFEEILPSMNEIFIRTVTSK